MTPLRLDSFAIRSSQGRRDLIMFAYDSTPLGLPRAHESGVSFAIRSPQEGPQIGTRPPERAPGGAQDGQEIQYCPKYAQDGPKTSPVRPQEAPKRAKLQPKRPSNRPKELPRWPRRPQRRLQNGPKYPEDRAPSKPPRGSKTAYRRLELARKLSNNAPEKPKSSNLRPCRCDPKGFSGLRCTRIRPHMRGKEGRGGLRYTVVRPWWRLLRSQTRAPLFFVLLLLRSQGGSREAQDVLKKPARPPYASQGSPN